MCIMTATKPTAIWPYLMPVNILCTQYQSLTCMHKTFTPGHYEAQADRLGMLVDNQRMITTNDAQQ